MTDKKQTSDLARLMSYKKKKEKTKVPAELKLHLKSYLIVFFLLIAVLLVIIVLFTY